MARILYGVNGSGRGHAIRALAVARHFAEHEFLFVGHDDSARFLRAQFRFVECPNPMTPVHAHRIKPLSTLISAAGALSGGLHWHRKLRRAAEAFKPDVAITDYEFFVPGVARAIGVPCLSLDNQHAMTLGRIVVPAAEIASWLAASLAMRVLYSSPRQYLVACFFNAPMRRSNPSVRWSRPLLRDAVVALQPESGDHVLAYQGYSTFPAFSEILGKIGRPVRVYGMGGGRTDGRVEFKEFDEEGFLQDLASCAYVICGGGHTLISEALNLGKPVLSIPVRGHFEQFMNSFYVEHCGYGKQAQTASFSLQSVRSFEKRLDPYRQRIAEYLLPGNALALAAVDDFVTGRWR